MSGTSATLINHNQKCKKICRRWVINAISHHSITVIYILFWYSKNRTILSLKTKIKKHFYYFCENSPKSPHVHRFLLGFQVMAKPFLYRKSTDCIWGSCFSNCPFKILDKLYNFCSVFSWSTTTRKPLLKRATHVWREVSTKSCTWSPSGANHELMCCIWRMMSLDFSWSP